ncbi:hypothetical protein L3Q82_000851 [Scortum barcoo]|uniref:Uncharacterized protein n=1 Tax=Scortum barcoo TaxID=214431 RepID=A0ACB8WF39_9TELE|nr:hypothetical protein L3Q82_000851 [Scortum barcoo]
MEFHKAPPFKEDKTLIFEPHENPQWPEGLEFCDTLVSGKAGMTPKIVVSVQNPTSHDITLPARTVIGMVQSVRAVYPASIFKSDNLPTTSVYEVQARSPGEDTPTGEQWDPPVDLTHLNEHQKQVVSQMLREESQSFSRSDDDIGCVENLQMDISLKDNEPVSRTYQSVPKPLYQEMKDYLQDLIAQGWVEKSTSSYSSPVVCVRKKDGTLSLCIDYRELNRKTHPDRHPIPRVQDIMDNLGGNTIFSLLDQGKAYHQGFMGKSSRHLTAFVTPWGLYEWIRIPFWTHECACSIPSTLHGRVLRGIKGRSKLRNHWEDVVHTVVRQVSKDIPVYELRPEKGKGRSRILHRNLLLPCDHLPLETQVRPRAKKRTVETTEEMEQADDEVDDDDDEYYSVPLQQQLQPCQPQALKSCVGSAMNQCEDREEGVPPSKTSLCGEHDSQTKAQRPEQPRPDCPGPEPEPEPEPGPGPGSEPSCVSFKSDRSNGRLMNFKEQHSPSKRVHQESSEVPSGQSAQQHQTHLDSIFMLLEENIVTFVKNELKKIQKVLTSDYPECLESRREDEEVLDVHPGPPAAVCQDKFKSNLQKKFQCVFEGIAKAGNPTLLNQIYTELYITEGGTAEVNDEHEVRQIETASRKADRPETTIRQEDIFKASPGRDEPIRRVMTKGVAGIGKTVLTQKFTLDWAEDKANQDIHFTFPFTFRELNVLKEKKFSLVELVHQFFTETKEAGICRFEEFQVVFIFDGLDECRLPLDFHNNEILTDVTESTSVDVLLTNLIRGKLLPSARLWITTRPAAANQIPPECVDMVTEVRGFTDPQKEEYFRKRFRNKEQASRIISHIKTSRSLHIMCHIPVFCWITATVLEDVLKTREGGELPKTLTEMYIHFLVVQSKVKNIKYDGGAETDPHWSPESRKMIEFSGKTGF